MILSTAVLKNKSLKNNLYPCPHFVFILWTAAEMGCGLNKLERREEKRPGNIYSTLKRPQVETKVDVAYEYRFLEFTTLSAGEYMPASFGFPGDPVLRPLCHVALSLSG